MIATMLSLLSTCALLLASSALAAPYSPPPTTNPYLPKCTSQSSNVTEWTINNFDFHASYVFTTPAHQNSWGYVNFTLANRAVTYTPVCSAASDQLSDFFYGNFVYSCTNVEVPGDRATFTFSRGDNQLLVNQTWACAGEGSRFTALGGVRLDLNCSDTTWQNPSWTPGNIYSQRTVTCGKLTVPAKIEEMSAVL
ncbi:hypothetical protein J3F83DRAFT_720175 [Trichoderma novae-zelandiae]